MLGPASGRLFSNPAIWVRLSSKSKICIEDKGHLLHNTYLEKFLRNKTLKINILSAIYWTGSKSYTLLFEWKGNIAWLNWLYDACAYMVHTWSHITLLPNSTKINPTTSRWQFQLQSTDPTQEKHWLQVSSKVELSQVKKRPTNTIIEG